ncbi:hypothetical protein TNCV_568011 [Trichonephila clavipes]|nr:hypothetical protein TNCV_568011 [Trichonephila clavipes]
MSEDFMEKHVNLLDWVAVSHHQTLSEPFIRKYHEKLDMDLVSSSQKLSENMIREYEDRTSYVHNFWPIRQILDGASAVCQDPDTVLIRVESMIEITTNSSEFRSKDGKVVGIPDADFNIVPMSVTKNTTPAQINVR